MQPLENPKIIKEYENVYFVYKPPGWNCVTEVYEYTEFCKIPEYKLIMTWIRENLKIDKSIDHIDYSYGLLNRLDMETSGIVMVAKNISSFLKYRKNINDHLKTTKIYLCVVSGIVEHEFGVIELPLYNNKLTRLTTVDDKLGKFSYTEYIKLKTYTFDKEDYTLLLVKIKTGRTHQIRVHLQSIGHLIICDKKYQTDKNKLYKECSLTKRLFLHALYYRIENDVDGYAYIPKDLERILKMMKIKKTCTNYNNAIEILKSDVITNIFLHDKKKELQK